MNGCSSSGAVTVTVNLNLNFRKECRQGEVLDILTRPERLGRASFALSQEIRKRTEKSPPTPWSRS